MAILVGIDLSAASHNALEVALAFAEKRNEDELILVHVAPPSQQEEAARARAAMEAEAARLTRPGLTVRAELVLGEVSATLVGVADTEHASLVVLGAHHVGERGGPLIGDLVVSSHVPVLVVRDPAPLLAFARGERPLRVLLGIDDSAVADLGAQWVHALRKLGPVDVVLGSIYYPDDACAHYGREVKSLVDDDPELQALIVRDLKRRFGGDGVNVTAHARHGVGRIGDHMIELANEERADVIVVGSSQKTGLGRLGSVSSVVVDDAPQSVVAVPPQASIPTQVVPVLRSSLVATDLSQFANRAVSYAFGIVEQDADVHIVHVLRKDDEADEAEVRRQLTTLAPVGVRQRVHAHVVRGDKPAKAIACIAAQLGVDVICIASHGRSGISRAFSGSVGDDLLRATRLPVLVLRPA